MNEKARGRALRFVVGRIRARIIRRFLLGGTTIAPLVGAFFAGKSALAEGKRAASEAKASDGLSVVPLLFAGAAICDASNSALLTVSTVKAVDAFVATTKMAAEFDDTLHAAGATAADIVAFLPPTASLVLSLAATTAAVTAEVLEQRGLTYDKLVARRDALEKTTLV